MILASHGIIGSQITQFVGLLDEYSGAAAAYSLRKLSATYTGSAIRVRRASDNTEQDIGFVNNELDTASLTTFCSGTNGFVKTWYDQSGNANDATQSTAANQPQIVSSGSVILENGKPSVDFDGSDDFLQTASFSTAAQPLTQFGVGRINPSYSLSTNYTFASSNIPGNRTHFFYRSTGKLAIFSGSSIQGIDNTTSIQFVFSALFNSPNSELILNGSSIVTGDSGSQSFGSSLLIGNQSSNFPWYGKQQEFIFYFSDQFSNRTGIETNINDFYSIY